MEDYKTIDCSGLEILGKGVTATVYKLDDGRMLKAYRREMPLSDIEKERDVTLEICEKGIMTPKCYGTVKTEEWYGNIYQMLTGGTLTEQMLSADEKGIIEWTTKYALLAKSIHSKKAGSAWWDITGTYRDSAEASKDILDDELYCKVRDIVQHIPDADSILHGDMSTGNIMVDKGEVYLIDLATVGKGHPVLDLIVPYMVTTIWPELARMAGEMSPEDRENRQDWYKFLSRYSAKAMSVDHGRLAWKQFLKVYFELPSADDDSADRITRVIHNCAMAKYCMVGPMRRFYSDELIKEMTQFFGSKISVYSEADMMLLQDDRWNL